MRPENLKSHRDFQDSGIEWLGQIPSEWTLRKLSHAFENIGSGTTPPSDSSEWYGGEIPWVTTGELREREIYKTTKTVTATALRNFPTLRIYPKGSIAIAMYGATIGRLGILGVEATTNQACCVLPSSEVINNSFLYYWFQAFREDIVSLASGGGQPNISQAVVGSLRLGVPKISEQNQIAKFLDYETAKIDALIEKQQQLIALLKEKRQAVISHAVTKGLNPDAPMRDSGVEWLGKVPAHWQVCRVKQATSFITSGPRGWSDLISEEGSDIFLQSGDLNDKLGLRLETAKRITPPRNAEGVRTKMQGGDVVVCITGANTGRVAVANRLIETVFVNQHLSLVRPVQERVHAKFLAIILASSPVKSYFAVKQYGLKEGLSLTNVAEAPLCLPPATEQQAIVAHLTTVGDRMDRLEDLAVDQVAVLQERRTALMSAAVTGKIDVRDWKPPESNSETAIA